MSAMGSIADQRSPANNLLLAPKLSTFSCLVPLYLMAGTDLVQSHEIKGGDRGRAGHWSATRKPAFTPAGEVVLLAFLSPWLELKRAAFHSFCRITESEGGNGVVEKLLFAEEPTSSRMEHLLKLCMN